MKLIRDEWKKAAIGFYRYHKQKVVPAVAIGGAAFFASAGILSYRDHRGAGTQAVAIPYSGFVHDVYAGQIDRVTMKDEHDLRAHLKSGGEITTTTPPDMQISNFLLQKGLTVEVAKDQSGLLNILYVLAGGVFEIGTLYFFSPRRRSPVPGIKMKKEKPDVGFADVGGLHDAKRELGRVVEFLNQPREHERLGAKAATTVMLAGPDGNGKSLLARAAAKESNRPFYVIEGPDFLSEAPDSGAERVRDLFQRIKRNAPCVVLIREFDAIAKVPGPSSAPPGREESRMHNQLCAEINALRPEDGVLLIAATDFAKPMSDAFTSRLDFDLRLEAGNPSLTEREEILALHARKIAKGPDVDLHEIARLTKDHSAADLAALVNEAANSATRAGKSSVQMADFVDACVAKSLGHPKQSLILTEEELNKVAYHEAGHVLVSLFKPGDGFPYMASIIPRGPTLGVAGNTPPNSDASTHSQSQCKARLASLYGARAAERFADKNGFTDGSNKDMGLATELAENMVRYWGMSRLGAVRYDKPSGNETPGYSGTTALEIDQEIRSILREAENDANAIITEHVDDLHRLAAALKERKTLFAEDIYRIVPGVPRPAGKIPPAPQLNS
jgi:cell division protease FtsH